MKNEAAGKRSESVSAVQVVDVTVRCNSQDAATDLLKPTQTQYKNTMLRSSTMSFLKYP